jgi:Cof subfamily protein (haloacid dehalogenase superfamily)
VVIRLIALDLDGTLLDSHGRISQANRDAICEALARGIRVAVVTGRSYYFAALVTRDLPSEVVLIVNNGAAVKCWDGAPILSRPLDRRTAAAVLTWADAYRDDVGIVFDREDGRHIVFERLDLEHPARRAYFERNRHVVAEVSPLASALDEDPLALVFNGPTGRMRPLLRQLEGFALNSPVELAVTEYATRDYTFIDVMAEGTSKGRTLARWAESQAIPAAAALAIGDNYNDADMLEWCGRPIVMANASRDLLHRGWDVTLSNDEAGVAAAIRRFAL